MPPVMLNIASRSPSLSAPWLPETAIAGRRVDRIAGVRIGDGQRARGGQPGIGLVEVRARRCRRDRADVGPVVRAGDRDGDRLGDLAAVAVVERDVIFLDDAFAGREILRGIIVDRVAPAERAVRGVRRLGDRRIDREAAEAVSIVRDRRTRSPCALSLRSASVKAIVPPTEVPSSEIDSDCSPLVTTTPSLLPLMVIVTSCVSVAPSSSVLVSV